MLVSRCAAGSLPEVWRGGREPLPCAGSTCEMRQEEAGSGRQGSKDQAVSLCRQDTMADALAQQFPMPWG